MNWTTFIQRFDAARKERRVATYTDLRLAAKHGYSPEEAAEANDAEARDCDEILKVAINQGLVTPNGWACV